jgi:hypothetical protein
MNFSDLLKNNRTGISSAVETQEKAKAAFPGLLAEKGLILRKPNGNIPEKGTLVLIGVAAGWSTIDLALLDEIYPALIKQSLDKVELFDVSTLARMDNLEEYIPRITRVIHTPIVGICHDSIWITRESGYPAQELLKTRYLQKRL